MSDVIQELLFEQGIQRDVVVSGWSDDTGAQYDLTGYSAVLKMRSTTWGDPAISKSTADGSIVIANIDGVWTTTASFTTADAASMTPAYMAAPVNKFGNTAYRAGIWELRLISDGGFVYSVASGPYFITLGVAQ